MKIDRSNYEGYFILYMDNELGSEERLEVEAFAMAHPDLQEELDLLMQSRLVPDEDVVFENKEELLEIASSNSYENLLLLYIDNELGKEDREKVQLLAATDNSVQQQLNLLLHTRAQADTTIVFPDKAILYRREEKRRPLGWWKMAAAAAILFAVATGAFFTINRSQSGKTTGEQVAVVPGSVKTPAAGTNSNEGVAIVPQETDEHSLAAANNTAAQNNAVEQPREGKPKTAPVENRQVIRDNQPDKNLVARVDASESNPGTPMITVPTTDIHVTTPPASENAGLAVSTTGKNTPQQNSNNSTVTRPANDTYSNMTASANRDNNIITANQQDNDEVETERSGKKNKLRGFFRKVTRTFEKTTHINATTDDDRLLVGGLAIRLK